MAFNNNKEEAEACVIDDSFDEIVSETPNQLIKLSSVSWFGKPYKTELRKWLINKDPNAEKPIYPSGKAVAMTDEAWHKTTEVLVNRSYGNTKNIIKAVSSRDDFYDAARQVLTDEDLETIKNTEPVVVETHDDFENQELDNILAEHQF